MYQWNYQLDHLADEEREKDLSVLPALLQASILALISTSIPLTTTITSTLIAVDFNDKLISDPSPAEVATASSIQVYAFSAFGDTLVMESDGNFDMNTWEAAHSIAARICNGSNRDGDDTYMHSDFKEPVGLAGELKATIQTKVSADLRWKDHSI